MKKILIVVVIAVLAHYAWTDLNLGERFGLSPARTDSALTQAFERRQSNLQVRGEGKVLRVLADDNDGSRHQRFILGLDSGQSLLVAHNIDLAPRIAGLREGDTVEFFGEYEWNAKGGVIHWTHRDPGGRHVPGWLKHRGRKYE
jgi:hypothetical protein